MNGTPLLLVDAYAQIYRGFHAVRGNLTGPDGMPTNALFAVSRFLVHLEKDFPSPAGAFVFDKGKPEFRLKLAPDYKANRPHMPEEMRCQIEPIRQLIRLFGWPVIEQEGFEADDLIGSLAHTFQKDHAVTIFSADKDLSQLVNDQVRMLVPDPGGKMKVRGPAEVLEHFGVTPGQIIDYLALLGDSADNIPGVDGVGPKTAAALLKEFSTGNELFASLERIPKEALRKKLQEGKDRFFRNVELIRLHLEAPHVWQESELVRTAPEKEQLSEFCLRYGLKSVCRDLNLQPELPPDDLFSPKETVPEKKLEKQEEMTQLSLF